MINHISSQTFLIFEFTKARKNRKIIGYTLVETLDKNDTFTMLYSLPMPPVNTYVMYHQYTILTMSN